MTQEQKAERYDEALEKIKGLLKDQEIALHAREKLANVFPELKENEDEKIRKELIKFVKVNIPNEERYIAWLEKQRNGTSWKPSKEEMDVLYSLSYITNQYDDYKEEVITRLYQDLKREFFNGASYENMFPTNTNTEDNVRRRSTIQILEYARSLDNYNQYGKADIDKNIAWLEKQGEQHSPIDINKMVDEFAYTEVNGYGIPSMIEVDAYHKGIEDTLKKQGEQKPAEWNKEDKARIKQLLGWLDTLKNYIHYDALVSLDLRRERIDKVSKLESWLKSLKQRLSQGLNPNEVIEWLRYHIQVDEPKIEYNEDGQPLAESFIAHAEARCMAADKVTEQFKKDFKL